MRMATLSVLKFNDPYGADRVLIALQGLQERQMITLQDAAVVSWPQGNKKPTTRQLHSMGGAGALGGAFWGFLFGLSSSYRSWALRSARAWARSAAPWPMSASTTISSGRCVRK